MLKLQNTKTSYIMTNKIKQVNNDAFAGKKDNTDNSHVGNNIKMGSADWAFSQVDEHKFDEHISNSVPGYEDCHQISLWTSDFFLNNDSVAIDLGSTTGTFPLKLAEYHKDRSKLMIKCIEIEQKFCQFLENKLSKESKQMSHEFQVINTDLASLDFGQEEIDLVTSFFTLQFIKPSQRSKILQRIYKSLNWGGALILFEKVRGSDARFQDILNYLLSHHKMQKGFSESEIFAKSMSLAGKMEPFSDYGNRQILENAGFKDIEVLYRNINFQGYLCIK